MRLLQSSFMLYRPGSELLVRHVRNDVGGEVLHELGKVALDVSYGYIEWPLQLLEPLPLRELLGREQILVFGQLFEGVLGNLGKAGAADGVLDLGGKEHAIVIWRQHLGVLRKEQ